MRTLVVFVVLGACSAAPLSGSAPSMQPERTRLLDTFRAIRAASPQQPKWTGPPAATIPAGVDGTITPVSDTLEVAVARQIFMNAYQAQVAATVGIPPTAAPKAPAKEPAAAASKQAVKVAAPKQAVKEPAPAQPKWTGPVAATVPAGLPGSSPQVADTPEVTAAKQQFFSIYNRQAAAAAPAVGGA
nr:cuticle protein CP1499-like [Penaeus vannamei]